MRKKSGEDESSDEDEFNTWDEEDEKESNRGSKTKPKSSYNEKLRKDYQKLVEKKERKRLLALKREIVNKPKKPKLLNIDVS